MSEKTLITESPAMFRNHPVWFLVITVFWLSSVVDVVIIWRNFHDERAEMAEESSNTTDSAPDNSLIDEFLNSFYTKSLFMNFVNSTSALLFLLVAFWWLSCRRTKLIVTTERTILKRGIIFTNEAEVRHSDIGETEFRYAGFLQKVFNVGEVLVRSLGKDAVDIQVSGIYNPAGIIKLVDENSRSTPQSQKATVLYEGFGKSREV